MTREFTEQVALVTGAGTGIGRATAVAFAREGARVIVSDVNAASAEETLGLIRRAGGDGRFIRCDVAEERDVQALIEGTIKTFGRLDIAFNNAGIEGTLASLADLTKADWDRVISVNLTGAFLCMKYELVQMAQKQRGAIVNNASILGTVGFATAAAYVAAKHGLIGLTRTAALEYAPKGIRVNAVCPGFIATPMLERAGLMTDPEVRKGIEALHAMNRLGTVSEVAEAVLFLASSKASFLTGHPLIVDGGYVAR